MNNKFKLLLLLRFFDNIVSGWLCVWWVSIFAPLLSTETFSYRNIIMTSLSIVFMGIMIYKKKETPRLSTLLIALMLSYVGLFGLFSTYDHFVLISTATSTIYRDIASFFQSSLLAQNIEPTKRNLFDNRATLVGSIGFILGSTLALVTLFEGYPIWLLWLCIYMVFDIDTLVTYLCIKKGYLNYDLNFNEDKEENEENKKL